MLFQTDRLTIRELTADDTSFIFELLNSQGFKDNIADRGIDTLEKALAEINQRYSIDYPDFGLFVVELKSTGEAIGGVTLIDRDTLDFPDLGYALLPQFYGKGYALEASLGLRDWAICKNIPTLVAIVNPDNLGSIRLLEKLDFRSTGTIKMNDPVQTLLYFKFTSEDQNSTTKTSI